jgi:hypothetical protein
MEQLIPAEFKPRKDLKPGRYRVEKLNDPVKNLDM